MLTRRNPRSRRALMERRLPPPTPRMPGRRWKSVKPVELDVEEEDPLESLELEEDMEPSSLLRRMPPRAPALPSRKIRLRRLSSMQRRRLAAKKKFNLEKFLRNEIDVLLQDVAELIDSNFAHYKNSRFESGADLMESRKVEALVDEAIESILEKVGPAEAQ